MGHGRTRKQAKLDKKQKYNELAGRRAEESARKAFERDVRKEYGVKQCLTKWGVDMKGVIASGNDKGTVSIVQEQQTGNRRVGLDAE